MLTPEQVLYGYGIGIFPMAHEEENNTIYWYEPELRGIIPLDGLKISKSLKQTLRSKKFNVSLNTCFEEVMRACADRSERWISEEIISVYCQLHKMGYAHSIEVTNADNNLVGGLYGVSLGKAFFGESMFHKERDTSKVALVYLVEWLNANQFTLLDTQYITDHLRTLGAIEIPKEAYLSLLKEAIN